MHWKLVAACAVVAACDPPRTASQPSAGETGHVRGFIRTDGPTFGEHVYEDIEAASNANGGVSFDGAIGRYGRTPEHAHVAFSRDAAVTGFDVGLPWSHVHIAAEECKPYDVTLSAGPHGHVKASCKRASADTLDLELTF